MILSESSWAAAAALAEALAETERFGRYAESLRVVDGPVDPGDRFVDSLLRVTAGGMGSWEGHVWMLGYWVSGDPMWNLEATERGRAFVADAFEVSNAAAGLFAWFRARLPSYPYRYLPQLVEGTHHTTREFSTQVRWVPRAEMARWQLVDFPVGVASVLGADDTQARALRDASVALLRWFSKEPIVQRHCELRRALTSDDITQLASCRRRLVEALASIDGHESRYAIPRHQFRQTTTEDALTQLGGGARDYVASFDQLTEALNRCLATVVPTLAVFGSPGKIGSLSSISLDDGIDGLTIEASVEATPSAPIVRVGRIYDARDSGFDDPLFVTGHAMNFSAASGALDTVSGELLEGGHVLLP